jgi:hypothetical protein
MFMSYGDQIMFFFIDIISWTTYYWYTRFSKRGRFQGTHSCQVRRTYFQDRGTTCNEWFWFHYLYHSE